MADYYPLIARAVAGLEKNTGGARRALYERARSALVDQLRGANPPLGESDITRERLALEEAIRKVEAEAARRLRFETPRAEPAKAEPAKSEGGPAEPASPPTARSEQLRGVRADAVRNEGARYVRPDAARAAGERAAAARADLLQTESEEAIRAEKLRIEALRSELTSSARLGEPEAATDFDRVLGASPPRRERTDPLAGGLGAPGDPTTSRAPRDRGRGDRDREGLKGFRDVVVEAEGLGGATALASRTARRTYAGVPAGEPARLDAHAEADGSRTTARSAAKPVLLEPDIGIEDSRPAAPRPKPPQLIDETDDVGTPRPLKKYVMLGIALLVAVGLASALYSQRAVLASGYRMVASIFVSQPATTTREAAPTQQSKIADRVLPGGVAQTEQAVARGDPSADQNAPIAPVAQRVVLYEEDPNDAAGKRFVGSAVWRTERVNATQGQSGDIAVRADIEIPDRRLTVTWSLRRNVDQTLPASHTIEILFTMPADFPHGGINNVPGILMKQAEQTRGTPLSGLAVKVTAGFFLIGLSAVEADLQRNLQLLRERGWFDIPIVYADGKRAILAVEKGTPGERAFGQAFAAWTKR